MDVYQNLSKFRGDSSLSTWIYKLTINKCLQHIRSKNTLKRKSETVSIKEQILDVPSFDHPGVTLENKELANTLMRAIDLLPEPQRVAFTLHKIERLSHEEISAIMDKSKSSIESLIHRAKQNLRTNLLKIYLFLGQLTMLISLRTSIECIRKVLLFIFVDPSYIIRC